MANYFYLTLDTIGPSNPTVVIEGNAQFISTQLANLTISTGDGATTGYQMKIWGNVDTAYDTNIQSTEATSSWISYTTSKQVKLLTGDGSKTINLKLRDDVNNESAIVSDTITLDTTLPVVTISGPDVSKISKQSGKNTSSFTFTSSEPFAEYKVKVVSSTGAAENTGTVIGTANGSVNTSGTAGNYDTSVTPISVQIKGADLELASTGDSQKIIKVFVKDASGSWSI